MFANHLCEPSADAVPMAPFLIERRFDDVELLDAVRSRFQHHFRIANATGQKRIPINFPAAFDRNQHRKTWSQVIDSDSIATLESRPRPVAFDFLPRPADCDRDQICGFFRHEALFVGNASIDESGFTYETLDLFPHATSGIECVYVDIFAPTDFVALRIHGAGFPVGLPVGEELARCAVFELESPFRTGAFELENESRRAMNGNEGTLQVVRNDSGFDEVHWSLRNPLLNKRYKIYFLADPSQALRDRPASKSVGSIPERTARLAAAFEQARQEFPNAWIAYREVWNGNALVEPFVVTTGSTVGDIDRQLERLPPELTDGVRIHRLGNRTAPSSQP